MRYLRSVVLPLLLTGCDALPVVIPNDTRETVEMDIHGRRFPTPVQLEKIQPSLNFGSRYCWKDNDAILLATKSQPDPIALDPKDFCDPDDCDCEIPVSRLVKQMTPSFVLKRQRETCMGRGPVLQPENRAALCEAYVARSVGNKPAALFSWEGDAMLR